MNGEKSLMSPEFSQTGAVRTSREVFLHLVLFGDIVSAEKLGQ